MLLSERSVAVMGDGRRYDYVIALRAVETVDFMTARWARLPNEFLELCSRRLGPRALHAEDFVPAWHHAHRAGAAGPDGAARGAGVATAHAPDEVSRRVRAAQQVAPR